MTDRQMEHHHAGLRAWAKGAYALEAATELLIRKGWAGPGMAWVELDEDRTPPRPWIDFDAIPFNIGVYSGGEQRFLRIAAALGGDTSMVNLHADVSGLDREHVALVLAAIAHANGSHEHSVWEFEPETGRPLGYHAGESLYPWPES